MGVGKFLAKVFSGSGIIQSVERVALEAIETDKEQAEAKALFVKTLDPNGAMRRGISQFVCKAYGFYLTSTVLLIVMHFFGLGDESASKATIEAITSTCMPITTAFGARVGASCGVNGINSANGK
mgnify:CR=1 FL=1